MSTITPLLQQRQGCDSWNLFLDKLSFQRGGEAEAKTESLQRAIKCFGTKATEHLNNARQRSAGWLKTLEAQHTARFRRISLYNHSPLILHLGRASVLKNVGLYADRTTGLPVIPGTALKGVLSSWATWEANQNEADLSFPDPEEWKLQRKDFTNSDHARRIFGCNNDGGSEQAGDMIFVGAYPQTVPKLGLDLVNPHHDEHGRDKAKLTPNAFVCIQPSTRWDFIFYARPGTNDADALLTTTECWLREALEHIGLGAKTAAGYGRFGKDVPPSSRAAITGKPMSKEDEERRLKDDELKDKALAAMQSDYGDDRIFKNRILDKLTPGALAQLEMEIPTLKKADNASRLQELKTLLASKDYKDLRKRLKEKAWFPQDWLPTP